MAAFADDFTRADGALGSNYDTLTTFGTLNVVSNQAGASAAICANAVKTSVYAFSADQIATVTVAAITGTFFDYLGPCVRLNAGATTGYCFALDGTTGSDRRLCRITTGGRVVIGAINHLVTAGDVLSISAVGHQIRVFINGALRETVKDVLHESGQPGVFYEAGNSGVARLDTFSADDLVQDAASPAFITSLRRMRGAGMR